MREAFSGNQKRKVQRECFLILLSESKDSLRPKQGDCGKTKPDGSVSSIFYASLD